MQRSIKILFENDRFVVFDKPAKLLVIPSPKKEKNTLVRLVNDQIRDDEVLYKFHPCHRLDRDTSGVILFAKGKKNQQWMMAEFKHRKIKKNYIAFVNGHIKPTEGVIKDFVKGLEKKRYRPQYLMWQ